MYETRLTGLPVLRFHDKKINHCSNQMVQKTNPNTEAKCDECLNYYFLNINVTDWRFKPIFQTILHPLHSTIRPVGSTESNIKHSRQNDILDMGQFILVEDVNKVFVNVLFCLQMFD